MDTSEISSLTPYPSVNTLLEEWVIGVRRVLGEKVVGLYLTGSLAYGDFIPNRSDIDLQAVVRSPLTVGELESVGQLHRAIERHCPEWANRVECSYIPLALMSEVSPPKTPRPWWGFGTLYAEAPAGNEWIINHYLLSKYGVALEGPDFRSLAAPIKLQQVRRASVQDLFQEWVPKINDPAWLSNNHYQSYLILNLCRILHTAVVGEPRSKKISSQWAKAAYPEWKDLIEEAERWTYGDQMKGQDDTIAFIRFAVEKVNEVYNPNTF